MRSALSLLAALLAQSLAAQSPPATVELSADSVSIAEVFELRLRVDVPPGSAVYFSDTLAATADVESFAPVEWRAERASDGEAATLLLTYALIPFGDGEIALPAPEIVIAPVSSADAGEALPGGSVVAEWADAPRASGRTIRRVDVSDQSIWVHPVRFGGALGAGVSPRGPDDVLGNSWSWPSIALVGFFSSVLAAAGVTTTRQWRDRRRTALAGVRAGPTPREEARHAALAAIELLIAGGPYSPDREREVYRSSSDVVRGFAARIASDWVPGLTSTELMTRFEGTPAASTELARAMALAERVKFGRLRTGSEALQAHLAELRTWLSESRS